MSLTDLTPFQLGAAGTLAAAAATGLGALGVFLPRLRGRDGFLFLAGASALMLLASVFSLAYPAGQLLAPTLPDLAWMVALVAGLALGAQGLRWLDRGTSTLRMRSEGRGPGLVILALFLHNIPEGLAVGTALAGPSPLAGLPLLAGILLHNLPEGLTVATLALGWGWRPGRAAWAGFLTGLSEPLAGLLAAGGTVAFPVLEPWILLGTAGAMIELVRLEILPQVRAHLLR